MTRLRNSCDHLCIGCTEENAHDVGLEAADEIERLRRMAWMMAGYISTLDKTKQKHPEQVFMDWYEVAEHE